MKPKQSSQSRKPLTSQCSQSKQPRRPAYLACCQAHIPNRYGNLRASYHNLSERCSMPRMLHDFRTALASLPDSRTRPRNYRFPIKSLLEKLHFSGSGTPCQIPGPGSGSEIILFLLIFYWKSYICQTRVRPARFPGPDPVPK